MNNLSTLIQISDPIYYIICGILSILVLAGIAMMSKVKTAARGNALSATAMGLGILITLLRLQISSSVVLWAYYSIRVSR